MEELRATHFDDGQARAVINACRTATSTPWTTGQIVTLGAAIAVAVFTITGFICLGQ